MSEDEEGGRGEPWTEQENQLVVADYFAMLAEELAGRPYNKAATLRALQPLLNERSRGSIEFKRANISAVLDDLGFAHLSGYLPRGNFQRALLDAVLDELQRTGLLEPMITSAEAGARSGAPPTSAWTEFASPPLPLARDGNQVRKTFLPRISDFPAREAGNRELGVAGEEWVLGFERTRLVNAGRSDLASRIEWTARERGDGFGYDIGSFEPDGTELLVEVKTTRMGKRWPFIVTKNELEVSRERRESYRIYRVFRFERGSAVYRLAGAIDESCDLEPKTYVARAG